MELKGKKGEREEEGDGWRAAPLIELAQIKQIR